MWLAAASSSAAASSRGTYRGRKCSDRLFNLSDLFQPFPTFLTFSAFFIQNLSLLSKNPLRGMDILFSQKGEDSSIVGPAPLSLAASSPDPCYCTRNTACDARHGSDVQHAEEEDVEGEAPSAVEGGDHRQKRMETNRVGSDSGGEKKRKFGVNGIWSTNRKEFVEAPIYSNSYLLVLQIPLPSHAHPLS